ncbi:hypothetical protein ANCCEY_15329 [Ancylostoma ceylanicum]|uniref:Threonylcarbamoyl-AMP synthase n=1 Tax=Ancylostoma ceylanicum TaxID=53326 RepID=A0A0D6L502_9BILA|nr:hypothetical protein ANCCEY_15329 [Ancylostoma ceylanicum]
MVYTYNSADSRIAENDQKQLNVGFATYHLNRPGYSFLSQPQERLYIRYSAFVNGAFGIRRTRMILEPGVYFHQQGNAREIMYGLYGRKEIGIRIPNNQIILEIVKELGNPVAVTSLHNEEDIIQEYFADPYAIYERYEGKVDYIIDGGYGNLDASTIVDCTGSTPEIIRQGIGILKD